MNKVGFVFDSSAIVPEEMAKKYGFEVVSLYLNIDGKSHLSTDIDEADFIANFDTFSSLKSASPSPQAFVDAYERLFAKGHKQIIVLPLSSKLSATHDVAVIAKDMLDEDKRKNVFVLDTLNSSLGFDAFMHSMAPLLEQDLDAEELSKIIMERSKNAMVLFEINDLKFLYRGGRLKKISLIVGEILKIKPIIEFSHGTLKVAAKNRNRNKNIEHILNEIKRVCMNFKEVYVNYFSFKVDEPAIEIIKNKITSEFKNVTLNVTKRICPVYISHVGTSGYAIAIAANN